MIKGKNKFLTILLCSFFSCVVLFGITLLSPNMTKVSASGELSKDFYVTDFSFVRNFWTKSPEVKWRTGWERNTLVKRK